MTKPRGRRRNTLDSLRASCTPAPDGHLTTIRTSGGGNRRHDSIWVKLDGKLVDLARVLYVNEYGPIPRGMAFIRSCMIENCVAPAHHEQITPSELHKRQERGKFSRKEIKIIVDMLRSQRYTGAYIAKLFRCAPRTIYLIRDGKLYTQWSGITPEDPIEARVISEHPKVRQSLQGPAGLSEDRAKELTRLMLDRVKRSKQLKEQAT